jgi:hypothetical protein
MKSRHSLLLAAVATLGLVGIGANLQMATAMPAPTLLAQSGGYTQTKLTIDEQSPGAHLASVYKREDNDHRVWYVGLNNDGKYVLLTVQDVNSDNTILALTPDGEQVKFH